MIAREIFDTARLGDLKKALDVYASRHRVVADNIANVETAGYSARELRFEQYLADASLRLEGARTDANHLDLGRRDLDRARPEVHETGSDFDNGINNVDIDREMTDLATNDLSYRLATRLLSMKYQNLRSAIRGRSV
ncbi:flagellar basal body rod protein FlgB [bacterium]|nr:flagellar basal body rod protein FlgB [bacterium]